jgi:hypothetical protein
VVEHIGDGDECISFIAVDDNPEDPTTDYHSGPDKFFVGDGVL